MNKAVVLACLIALQGCASDLYIAKEGYEPHGYSSEEIDETRYLVVFETHQDVSTETTSQLAQYRAAELAKSLGFEYVVLGEIQSKVEHESVVVPAIMGSTASTPGTRFGPPSGLASQMVVPEHTLEFEVKRSRLEVEFTNDASIEDAISVTALLETNKPDQRAD